jgi:hypothetical protein
MSMCVQATVMLVRLCSYEERQKTHHLSRGLCLLVSSLLLVCLGYPLPRLLPLQAGVGQLLSTDIHPAKTDIAVLDQPVPPYPLLIFLPMYQLLVLAIRVLALLLDLVSLLL